MHLYLLYKGKKKTRSIISLDDIGTLSRTRPHHADNETVELHFMHNKNKNLSPWKNTKVTKVAKKYKKVIRDRNQKDEDKRSTSPRCLYAALYPVPNRPR